MTGLRYWKLRFQGLRPKWLDVLALEKLEIGVRNFGESLNLSKLPYVADCFTVVPNTPPSPNQHPVFSHVQADKWLVALYDFRSPNRPISVFVSRYTWYECTAGREKQSKNLIDKTYS